MLDLFKTLVVDVHVVVVDIITTSCLSLFILFCHRARSVPCYGVVLRLLDVQHLVDALQLQLLQEQQLVVQAVVELLQLPLQRGLGDGIYIYIS